MPNAGSSPPKIALAMQPFGQLLMSGLHHTVAALAAVGHNVVVDHVLCDQEWLPECLALWQTLPVVFVGVRCPLDVVRARTLVRTDRTASWPEYPDVVTWQFDEMHQHTRGIYDVEVDTSRFDPKECALQIKRHLDKGYPPHAFKRLAALIPRQGSLDS